MSYKPKLVRITTVPISLEKLIAGQMNYMGENGFEVTMISSDFEGKQKLEVKENAKFIPVNMTRVISPLADLKSLYQLIRILQRLKPQIVHTHTPKAGLLGMLAAWITNVPIRLHTIAGMPLMETTGFKRSLLDVVERLIYRCATQVYPNSQGLYDFVISNKYTDAHKLKVMANGSSNGIDTTHFNLEQIQTEKISQLKEELGIQAIDFVFVFVGRLVGDKGINELIVAFNILSKKHTNIKLLLVGPEESDLDPLKSETLQEIKSNTNIIAVGSKNDVRPYFAIAHALVFPSYREGFPNVVMQAGAMRLPAIVSDINGCNEIIEHEVNGLIIPVKDEHALCEAMDRLYNDSVLYQKLSANARDMITSRYEQEVVWNAILEEYNGLIELIGK